MIRDSFKMGTHRTRHKVRSDDATDRREIEASVATQERALSAIDRLMLPIRRNLKAAKHGPEPMRSEADMTNGQPANAPQKLELGRRRASRQQGADSVL